MILQADSHDPEGRFASSRGQSHEPGTHQLIDYADIPVASSKERDILMIKWRRILRINWRSRERGAGVRSLVAGARWASVFPSGNHGVRLFVGDEGFLDILVGGRSSVL
jgi:hypothetical protein